jgi:hypothetical protein
MEKSEKNFDDRKYFFLFLVFKKLRKSGKLEKNIWDVGKPLGRLFYDTKKI